MDEPKGVHMNKPGPVWDFVRVLDVSLYAGDIECAVEKVVASCLRDDKDNRCISATGAHGLVYARKNPAFREVLGQFFLNLPDGMPGVWIGKIKGAGKIKRCYGPEFFKQMMIATAKLPITHFFCGGNEGVAEELKKSVESRFGNNNIVGVFTPPFLPVDEYDYNTIANSINNTKANIVWIGLSTPKQEQFALHLSSKTNVNYIIAVGAAFDFHIGKIMQAPLFMQRVGLEWLFRMLTEPRRLFRRYFEIVPMFIYYNLREFFSFVKN